MAKTDALVRPFTYRDAVEFLREQTGVSVGVSTLEKAKLAGEIPAERLGEHMNARVVFREDHLLAWLNGQIRPDEKEA